MATVDMTHRKLNFPPRFLPYLEKHRIFELLHECVELLVQIRPRDHIQFLKKILPCAARKKDKQRIVFLAPSNFDSEKFSENVAECLGIQAISKLHMELWTKEKVMREQLKDFGSEEEAPEEMSCICPGEGELSIYEAYFQEPEESAFSYQKEDIFVQEEEKVFHMLEEEEEGVEEEEEEEEKKKEEEECICVCPCVGNKGPETEDNKLSSEVKLDEIEEEVREAEEDEPDKDEPKIDEELEKDEETVKEEEPVKDEEPEKDAKPRKAKKPKKVKEPKKERTEKEENKDQRTPSLPPSKPRSSSIKLSSSGEGSSIAMSVIEIDYQLLAECETASKGWILTDFPKSKAEAEKLSKLGILPTHAIRIIVNEEEEKNDRNYKWTAMDWMKAYNFVPVMEIRMGKRTLEEFSKDMCQLFSVMPHRHAPMLPRIVLIGSRGSGVTTQAQKLSKKYGLVHVEFELVIARLLQQDDDIARLYKEQLETRVEPEVEAVILEKALLTKACINRGWVLTGYPKDIDQLRMLDIIATPPNRLIFIEVPARECFVRLYYRKIDPCLGDEYKLPQIEPFGADSYVTSGICPEVAGRLLSHPKNNKKQIIHDIETYFLKKRRMMAYCGKTASYIDGNRTVNAVFELIEQVLINPAPAQPPRDPLVINYGIDESYERLKKFRLASGMFFNNLLLNPPG